MLPLSSNAVEPQPLGPELDGALRMLAKAAGVDQNVLMAVVRDTDLPVDAALGRLLLALGRSATPPGQGLRPAPSAVARRDCPVPRRPRPYGALGPRVDLPSRSGISPAFRPKAATPPPVESTELEFAARPPQTTDLSPDASAAVAVPGRHPVAVAAQVIGPALPVRMVDDGADLPRRRRQVARAALWLRNVGIIIVLFLGYQLWGTRFEQHRAQAHLRAAFQRATTTGAATVPTGRDTPVVDRSSDSARPSGVVAPAAAAALGGGVVARIQVPVIAVDQYVVEGTGEAQLKRGPGHYAGTPLPGQPGNSAIAGHRTTYGAPFNRLDGLHPGDAIYTTTAAGRFLYSVTGKLTVSPSQTSVVDDYGDNRLTLTTCTPEFSATHRLIVVAALIGPAPSAVVPHTAPPPRLTSIPRPVPVQRTAPRLRLPTDSWKFDAWACCSAILVGFALVGVSLAYRPLRRFVPPMAAAVVLAPFWVAGVLLLFEQLTRFLPANV